MKKLPHLLLLSALLLSLVGFLPGAALALQGLDAPAGQQPQAAGDSPPTVPTRPPLFLPFLFRPTYSLSGQVTDGGGSPLAGVTLSGQDGRTAVTDSGGKYAFNGMADASYAVAPSRSGYVFSPAMVSIYSPGEAARQNFTALTATELIVNGGFETSAAWELPVTEHTAVYTTEGAHTGARSALTGITKAGQNTYSYSSVRQLISIPVGVSSATLTLWLYPYSTEAGLAPAPAQPAQATFSQAALTSDAQYVLVLDKNNNLVETLLWMRSNNQQWTMHTFNLKKYAGQQIKIQAGTYNDGFDGVTALYVDDVSVQTDTTSGGTPPTPTPTTAPPAPGTCTNPIGNPGFEVSGSWSIPITEYPAAISTDVANSGTRSMRTGIVKAAQNRYSYSDGFQSVTIPSNAANPYLSLYIYRTTTDATALNTAGVDFQQAIAAMPANIADFGKAPLVTDLQYIMVIDANGTIHYLYQNLVNDPSWAYKQYSLAAYKGQTIQIRFGTYNNGLDGISAMYVDDVYVDNCAGASPTATPPPTPPPGVCTEKFGNNSFETNTAWEIPITAFSAGYSVDQAHTGARSMRSGIVHAAHNRYSYSDFRQAVTIPTRATSATLSMWLYPSSGEAAALTAQRPTGELLNTAALAGDVQYVLILDVHGNWIDTLVWQRSNAQAWSQSTFDLTAYAGTTIQIQFGVYNDGWNGITSMYVDDVTMQVCP